jgi:rhodanese-related sulfurtransferase
LATPAVARLGLELRAVAEQQLVEVEQTLEAYRSARHKFRTISVSELQDLLHKDAVILLDVRPAIEYANNHIPGALSFPVDELEARLVELPIEDMAGKMIVAYCRGPYCVYADDALAILAAQGWAVARLEEGVVEWELAEDGLN